MLQIEDITARKHAEERLIHQTLHDALTGLPNRVLLSEHLTAGTGPRSSATAGTSACFSSIWTTSRTSTTRSDTTPATNCWSRSPSGSAWTLARFRHRCPARRRRIRRRLRRSGRPARKPSAVAERVEQALDITIDVRGQPVSRVRQPRRRDQRRQRPRRGHAAQRRRGDVLAKEHGRGRYEVFDVDLQARAVRQLSLEADLRRAAVRATSFACTTRRVTTCDAARIVGVEALLRWEHPDRGLLAPIDFLDVAEDRRLMIPLGEWVLRTACEQAAEWHRRLRPSRPGDLGQHLLPAARAATNSPRTATSSSTRRELVPTGSASSSPNDRCSVPDSPSRDDLDGLSDLGVTLAVDDFGTGLREHRLSAPGSVPDV